MVLVFGSREKSHFVYHAQTLFSICCCKPQGTWDVHVF